MQQFFAILKDSFYEAVDGFVIYTMLGLAALVIVIVGSLSFTPAAPNEAFDKIVKNFSLVFAEEGRSRAIQLSTNIEYRASDVRAEGNGYKLRLTVDGNRNGGGAFIEGPDSKIDPVKDKEKARGDSFRETVAAWARPAGESQQVEKGGKKIAIGEPMKADVAEQLAVTDAQIVAFIKNQFLVHAGMDATVTRVLDGVEEPTYVFDVTTTGGSSVRGWPHTTKIFFGTVTISSSSSLGMVLWVIEDQIINGFGATLTLLISIIITAFFIPNMMRKGSIDLLISKPIGRSQLLVYKYFGGLTFIFLLTAFTVGGIWLALGIRSGYWDPSFLVVIPVLTFTFAILYAMSTAAAVFTRSPIVAMLATVAFAVFLYIVGQVKTAFDMMKKSGATDIPGWVYTLVETINNVLPRYKDLDKLTSKLIADGTLTAGESRMGGMGFLDYPSWGSTLSVSLAFIVVMLAVSCWRFSKRDY